MDKKRILAGSAVVAVLDVLIHLQYQHWRSFDWATFWAQTHHVNKWQILYGTTLIYFAYLLRAVRWRSFVKRVRPGTSVLDLVSPTIVGFTGLALLGRAGEFIRPYLIARRTNLPVSSQLAAWAVERIFDIAAFTLLMLAAILLPSALASIPHPEYYRRFQEGGFLLAGLVVAMTVGAVVIARVGESAPKAIVSRFGSTFSDLGLRLAQGVRRTSKLLTALHGPALISWVALICVRLWLAYGEAAFSHDADSFAITISRVVQADLGILVTASFAFLTGQIESVACLIEQKVGHLPTLAAQRMREFGEGLKTIHGTASVLWVIAVSLGMWYVIALAYKAVTHSYGVDALDIPVSQVLILMGASMVGSMLQLPAVGGGSQMATIAILSSVFDVPPELAASCGILLWLVTFAAVVPVGLLLAHHERLSLRKLSVESHQAGESDDQPPPPA
jgi:uncharacterized membrane protein YbhN (UPF0104 family)